MPAANCRVPAGAVVDDRAPRIQRRGATLMANSQVDTDAIRQSADIADVIGRYVKLRPAGGSTAGYVPSTMSRRRALPSTKSKASITASAVARTVM